MQCMEDLELPGLSDAQQSEAQYGCTKHNVAQLQSVFLLRFWTNVNVFLTSTMDQPLQDCILDSYRSPPNVWYLANWTAWLSWPFGSYPCSALLCHFPGSVLTWRRPPGSGSRNSADFGTTLVFHCLSHHSALAHRPRASGKERKGSSSANCPMLRKYGEVLDWTPNDSHWCRWLPKVASQWSLTRSAGRCPWALHPSTQACLTLPAFWWWNVAERRLCRSLQPIGTLS